MGLLSGSASFVRYKVVGEMPGNFWDFAGEKVALHAFRDIDDNYEERSVGWVSVANMFDSSFQYASYGVGDYIVLTLRIDERKVAPRVLKKFCLKEEERLKKERQIPKLSRAQKLDIKENVRLMLLKKAVPGPATYDLCWNLAILLCFFSQQAKKPRQSWKIFSRRRLGCPLCCRFPTSQPSILLEQTRVRLCPILHLQSWYKYLSQGNENFPGSVTNIKFNYLAFSYGFSRPYS